MCNDCRIVAIRDAHMVCTIQRHHHRTICIATWNQGHVGLGIFRDSCIVTALKDKLLSAHAIQIHLILHCNESKLLVGVFCIYSYASLVCWCQGFLFRRIKPWTTIIGWHGVHLTIAQVCRRINNWNRLLTFNGNLSLNSNNTFWQSHFVIRILIADKIAHLVCTCWHWSQGVSNYVSATTCLLQGIMTLYDLIVRVNDVNAQHPQWMRATTPLETDLNVRSFRHNNRSFSFAYRVAFCTMVCHGLTCSICTCRPIKFFRIVCYHLISPRRRSLSPSLNKISFHRHSHRKEQRCQ